ncbi:MAG TPA: hypothetical protein DEG17_06145 [Cyanobacteria bacterium UBA11149]|nr:hypothetical protein [Cyanobacteria bacterium UBA11159]HBW88458.1 hypothetical protein [Cyanobacteria bacterium UBA11149]
MRCRRQAKLSHIIITSHYRNSSIYEGTMTQLHRYLERIKFDSFRMAAIEKVTQGITTLTEV